MTEAKKSIHALRTPNGCLTLIVDLKYVARVGPEGLITQQDIRLEDKDDVIAHLLRTIWRSDREEMRAKRNKVYRVTIEEEGDE